MIRKMTRKKKHARYDANAAAVILIYQRATQGGSADYLAINQPSEPERITKILAEAEARRERRRAKRRANQ